MKEVLTQSEISCHEFLDKIDEVLQVLSNIIIFDVTGRTNTLMRSCEDLLEQQVFIY
jgi:putative N-acetylmannosamine-6-phosphate epimerase